MCSTWATQTWLPPLHLNEVMLIGINLDENKAMKSSHLDEIELGPSCI